MKAWKIVIGFLILIGLLIGAKILYLGWFPLFEILGVTVVVQLVAIVCNKIKKTLLADLLINFSLAIEAICLLFCIAPPAIIYTILVSYYKYDFRTATERISDFGLNIGESLDQSGNVIGMDIFSDTLLASSKGKQFGNPDETVSHVTGVKEAENDLSWLGEFLAFALNLADKGHTKDAKDSNQQDKNQREK